MARFDFKNSSFWPYFWIVKKQRQIMENKMSGLCLHVQNMTSTEQIVQFVREYCHANLGYYSIAPIEQYFLHLAQSYDEDCDESYEPKSYLHVATWVRPVGGHGRVIERWINNSPNDERHSLVVLNEESCFVKSEIPQWLYIAVGNKGGQLYTYEEGSIVERALRLRKLASKFDKIILHIAIEDPTALIAFGTNKFKRPIVFFNHTSHVFWLGVSIADMVADLTMTDFTTRRRHAKKCQYLGIPIDILEKELISKQDRNAIRNELGIPQDEFVIISTGTIPKYTDIGLISFRQMAQVLVAKTSGRFLLIGPGDENNWQRTKQRTNARVNPLGIVADKELYYKYLKIADVYIDSYCIGGLTASLDAIQVGVPVLSFMVSQQSDYFMWDASVYGDGICKSENELIQKVCMLQKDVSLRTQMASNQLSEANKKYNIEWQIRLHDLLINAPQYHEVHPFANYSDDSIINDNDIVNFNNYKRSIIASYKVFYYFMRICTYIKYHFMYIRIVHKYPFAYVKYDINRIFKKWKL